MCLGVPGRVAEWLESAGGLACAVVEFGGVRRSVCMACVPEAAVGDYVIVHAGVAIARLDAAEAERVLVELQAALDEPAEDGP
jgi:hydrogenase expression/formation protein HypC